MREHARARLVKEEGLKDIIDHLLKEEKKAADAIKKIKSIQEEDAWESEFSAFRKGVLHHAEEEQDKLFPKVKDKLDESELDELGTKIREFKQAHLK